MLIPRRGNRYQAAEIRPSCTPSTHRHTHMRFERRCATVYTHCEAPSSAAASTSSAHMHSSSLQGLRCMSLHFMLCLILETPLTRRQESNGLEFFSIGGDPEALMASFRAWRASRQVTLLRDGKRWRPCSKAPGGAVLRREMAWDPRLTRSMLIIPTIYLLPISSSLTPLPWATFIAQRSSAYLYTLSSLCHGRPRKLSIIRWRRWTMARWTSLLRIILALR
jgi:hypothetical protein